MKQLDFPKNDIRVLTIHKGEHQDGTLYRLKKGQMHLLNLKTFISIKIDLKLKV